MTKCENTMAHSTVLTAVTPRSPQNPTSFHQEIVRLITEKPHVLQACLHKTRTWAWRDMSDAHFNSHRYWQVSGKQQFGRSCFWTLLPQKYFCIILHSCVRHWQSSKRSPKTKQRSSLALFKTGQCLDYCVVTAHTQATSPLDHKLPFQYNLHRKKWGILPS